MRKIVDFIIVATFCFLLSSCSNSTNSAQNDKEMIVEIIEEITEAFNYRELNKIMPKYHYDFLNNGNNFDAEEDIWISRYTEFVSMEIIDLRVELITSDTATASFILKFLTTENQTSVHHEPNDLGDLSYFVYDEDKWSIYGNRKN